MTCIWVADVFKTFSASPLDIFKKRDKKLKRYVHVLQISMYFWITCSSVPSVQASGPLNVDFSAGSLQTPRPIKVFSAILRVTSS